jgi:hypothetical protein
MTADTSRIRMTFWTFLRLTALFAVRGTLPSCENRNLKNERRAQAISSSKLFKQLDSAETGVPTTAIVIEDQKFML